jgi:glutamate-1-semialdehyde aminotransferase
MMSEKNCPISREAVQRLRQREDATFAARTKRSAERTARARAHMPGGVPMAWMKGLYRTPPLYVTHGEGARFFDVDGNGYLDFNVADLAMTMGYGPGPIVEAVSRQVAEGALFLLATEDSAEVAEELARRGGLPFWQFTLSASGANSEVMRIARFATGREKILVFEGHYHGHIDETLVEEDGGRVAPALLGLPANAGAATIILPFNDLDAVEATLKSEDVALIITEPALTNCNLLLPQPGFLEGLRRLTEQYGTLLCFDEAHSYQFAYGGLVGDWALDCDFHVLGKGLGTGISFALYGMSSEIAALAERHPYSEVGPAGLATGGTTYASALAAAAAKAALFQVLTPENHRRIQGLGTALAKGLEEVFAAHALPWRAFHLGPRSGYCMTLELPLNFRQAKGSLDSELVDTRRVFMANRGIWDAVAVAGPQASFAHGDADIDEYLSAADAFFAALRQA